MAIAFIDFEMNCNEFGESRNNHEIVQIAMLVYERIEDEDPIDTFYRYVRLSNNEKLTCRCKKITGITEKNLKKAPKFKYCYNTIKWFIEKYNIQTIYCYGDYDEIAFNHTAEKNSISDFQSVSHRFKDLAPVFRKKLALKGNISLLNLSLILRIPHENQHNALSDAEQLKRCYQVLETKSITYINDYKKYEILRKNFNNLKSELKNCAKNGLSFKQFITLYTQLQTLEKEGLSLEKFISLYKAGKFPTFEEYLQSKF